MEIVYVILLTLNFRESVPLDKPMQFKTYESCSHYSEMLNKANNTISSRGMLFVNTCVADFASSYRPWGPEVTNAQ